MYILISQWSSLQAQSETIPVILSKFFDWKSVLRWKKTFDILNISLIVNNYKNIDFSEIETGVS